MTNNSSAREDEINLIELIIKIWEGKWKILTIMLISIIFMIINNYLSSQKEIYFNASTNVQPISTFEENSYIAFNNKLSSSFNNKLYSSFKIKNEKNGTNTKYDLVNGLNLVESETINNINGNISLSKELVFYKLSKLSLFEVYIELLNDKKLFEEAIRKYNLLDVNKYSDEQQYNSQIINLASSVKIITNASVNNDKNSFENLSAQIQIRYNDADKWKKVLKYVDEQANKAIKQNLIKHFDALLLIAQDQIDHKLEDISIAINNLIIDYETVIANKLIYLEEHSQMARKLGLAKNTIEVESDFPRISLLAVVKADTPYYLRGYEAIDKEIELIKARTDVNPFIPGLIPLEQAKRAIQQDKSLERAKELFSSTPIFNDQFFYAASINTLATKFSYQENQQKKKLVLATVIGLFLGVFYVIISNAFKSVRRSRLKQT